MRSCLSRSDWLEVCAMHQALLSACIFSLNSPAHNFELAYVEFVNIFPYANINSLLCMDFVQDLMVKIDRQQLQEEQVEEQVSEPQAKDMEMDDDEVSYLDLQDKCECQACAILKR